MTMTTKQKQFIRRKLIPFILRERGRGYVQTDFIVHGEPGETYCSDDYALVQYPSCGTVACIAGSIAVLRRKGHKMSMEQAARILGLSGQRSNRLFSPYVSDDWPEPYASRFAARRTPLGRAKVAAALLLEVAHTSGAVLDVHED